MRREAKAKGLMRRGGGWWEQIGEEDNKRNRDAILVAVALVASLGIGCSDARTPTGPSAAIVQSTNAFVSESGGHNTVVDPPGATGDMTNTTNGSRVVGVGALGLTASAATTDGWSSVTGFRHADTAVQRRIVQTALAANGQSSGRSMMGPPWLTDAATGDGERMRIAITRWYDYRQGRMPGMPAAQVQDQMRRDLSATYDSTRQTALVNRMIEQWNRRFSIIGPPSPPPRAGDDQGVLDFMGMRKQCLEWADTIARDAGGRALNYSAPGLAPAAVRAGMGLFNVGVHAMIIVDVEWRGGVPVRFKVAEANYGSGWMNPAGQVPWDRMVAVGRIVAATYKVVSFE